MKKKYEEPKLEIIQFNVEENLMQSRNIDLDGSGFDWGDE